MHVCFVIIIVIVVIVVLWNSKWNKINKTKKKQSKWLKYIQCTITDYDIIEVDHHVFNVNLKILMTLPFKWNSLAELLDGSFYFFGFSGVSISIDDQRNVSATLLKEVGYFFSERRSIQLVFILP